VTEIQSVYRPTPPQAAYRRSTAMIRGYGGAMGGGKSRALCEQAFDYALDHPGILIPVFRQEHTSIVRTTKRTFFEQVLPPELLAQCDTKNSQGEDWIRLPNDSELHFVGLSDPIRWFSSEIGAVFFDEAQEMPQEYVVRLITRLRQRCRTCIEAGAKDCQHMPHTAALAFNPDNPGHWLQQWFILGAERTEFGFRKERLHPRDENGEQSEEPLGDAEFIFAKATDNPYLSEKYLRTLRGLPPADRKRYLEGLWEYQSGTCFFTREALQDYQERSLDAKPLFQGRTDGDVEADALWRTRGGDRPKKPVRVIAGGGPLAIYHKPVKASVDDAGRRIDGHRYVMGIDVSSGGSKDYSAIIVMDVEDWAVAARFQGKLTPTELAEEAYRLGRVYNNALAVPEITGGYGFTVDQELKRFRYPSPYTRRRLDRLTKKWTDITGWDTTVKTRAHMLDTLDRVLREGELDLADLATVNELATFVRGDSGKPEAQPGCNDDLVMALAIAVTVAADTPRQLVRLKTDDYRPAVSSVTGY
jgi:hypothetical protein